MGGAGRWKGKGSAWGNAVSPLPARRPHAEVPGFQKQTNELLAIR